MFDIIIPAYNCSKTLRRTLHSLASQSDTDFTCTLVDDCSNEDLVSIISEFKDIKINYIRNKTNLGCGMTRQVGINNTHCDYFTFLDSDDMIMPHFVEVFNQKIKNNADIIFGGIFEQTNNALKYHRTMPTWCHGKLYKRSFIDKYNIKNRPDIKWADDSFFNSICFELAGPIETVDVPMIYYSFNPNSVTRIKDEEREKLVIHDFLNGMLYSCEFVSQYKNSISHLDQTELIIKQIMLNKPEEKELCELILSYKGGKKHD